MERPTAHLATGKNMLSATVKMLDGQPDGPVAFHYPAPDFRDDLLRGGAVR